MEAVLNYSNFSDVNEIIRILGIQRVARIFQEEAGKKRCNLRPEVKHYFQLYFKKYAGIS